MSDLTLIIGNKNYSSWSLRPWLLLKQAGIPFREVRIPLYGADTRMQILKYSPSGKVPALVDGDLTVWESLAICEHVAERFPDKALWPADLKARALARAAASEMHAGFSALRNNMPMNVRRSFPTHGRTPEVLQDIERIAALWQDCRSRYGDGGPFLFGRFSVADAMFAPVAFRFQTYVVDLPSSARAYTDTLLALPAMREWATVGRAETEIVASYEFDTAP